ncbi:MAG TPA: MOSC domain-containing protein [Saprospiraceae bacterium]|nr:MOSC domain-containing protein [Saprospiraceae bacterium]
MGSITSIVIRPEKRGVTQHLQAAHIHAAGIEGDHFVRPETKRSVTLVAADDLARVAANIGFQGDAHGACRRNICVDSFPEENMEGKRIALGDDVILEITCYCTPCKRMDENFGDGAVQAFDHAAGWGAIVIREGDIKVGDTFRVL